MTYTASSLVMVICSDMTTVTAPTVSVVVGPDPVCSIFKVTTCVCGLASSVSSSASGTTIGVGSLVLWSCVAGRGVLAGRVVCSALVVDLALEVLAGSEGFKTGAGVAFVEGLVVAGEVVAGSEAFVGAALVDGGFLFFS